MSGVVGSVAAAIGAPEAAFRILLSIVASVPVGWVLRSLPPVMADRSHRLGYLCVTGLAIGWFNFGTDVKHSAAAVAFCYVTSRTLGPTKVNVIVNFVFHMTYLLVGYWVTGTDTYDIKWTMPHCVLTLRLIGLSFDLWDGSKPPEKLSASNKLTALRETPDLVEMFAHVFFPGAYLVGPQFSMVRFKKYLDGEYDNAPGPSCVEVGAKRALLGLGYMLLYQIGTLYVPDDYLISDAFHQSSIVKKHLIVGVWGKITLSKYIACWLLTEGACITFGLAYDGVKGDDKQPSWAGCRNVEVGIFESGTRFGHYIDSFNINTNHWVAQYIYKRAAFLGSREMSQAITLGFLAIWHGFHSGYYITFFMEFSIMLMEKQALDILERGKVCDIVKSNKTLETALFLLSKLYLTVFMGYCLVPFTLLSFDRWWHVYSSLYFSGFVLFFPWIFLYKPLLKRVLKMTGMTKETPKTK